MSGAKRKYEEFRDPDYEDCVVKIERRELTAEEKIEKIKSIIQKEFLMELSKRYKSLSLIDERLLEARKMFQKLRYAIVNNFYNNKKFNLTDDDVHKEVMMQNDPTVKSDVYSLLTNEQKRIHPAVKNTLNNDQFEDITLMTQRSKRKKPKISTSTTATTLTESITNNLRPVKLEPNYSMNNSLDITSQSNKDQKSNIKPMYVEPKMSDSNILKIDSGRANTQKRKFRIIIGNTSKYVEPDSSRDRVTHRWLLYIRSPPSCPDISNILEYVTVQLHDSYIPHNIINIRSSPFHLSRRGWGEFPVKLRLHFKNELLNKPINVVHNLKLDRLHTGLQTLGGETIVDVSLYPSECYNNTSNLSNCIVAQDEDNDLSHFNNLYHRNIKTENDIEDSENKLFDEVDFIKKKIKDEPLDNDEVIMENYDDFDNFEEFQDFNGQIFNAENSNDCEDKIYDTFHNINNMANSHSEQKYDPSGGFELSDKNKSKNLNSGDDLLVKIVMEDHSYCSNLNQSTAISSNTENVIINKLDEIVGLHQIAKWFDIFNIKFNNMFSISKIIEVNKSIINKVNVYSELDRNMIFSIGNITTINKIIISCYVKELSSLLWKKHLDDYEDIKKILDILQNIHSINDSYFNMKQFTLKSSVLKIDHNESREKNSSIGEALFTVDSLFKDLPKIKDIRCFVNIMLKRMPIVNKLAHSIEFLQLFPFTVENSNSFYSMNVIKRRNLQWTRAKLIRCFLEKYFIPHKHTIWSTKQIIIFSQYHGYFPIKENSVRNRATLNDQSQFEKTFEKSSDINTKALYNYFDTSKSNGRTDDLNKTSNSIDDGFKSFKDYDNNFHYISDSSDDEVDICNDTLSFHSAENMKKAKEDTDKTKSIIKPVCELLPFENETERIQCKFVEDECLKIGIDLKNQNIGHGYTHGVAHKIILSSVKCLIEDILRRSLAVKMASMNEIIDNAEESTKIDTNNINAEEDTESKHQEFGESCSSHKTNLNTNNLALGGKIWKMSESECNTTLSLRNVFEGLKTRKEFDLLTNFGLGSKSLQFQEEL